MNKELAKNGEKRMTVKEVAEALGYERDTIRKKVKELFPELVENGKTTLLNELQVTAIRQSLVPRTLALKSEVDSALTEFDMMERAADVMRWLYAKVEQERAARIDAERKNAILMHVSKTYTATEIAKELNMRSAIELNKKLADMKIQFKQNDTWVLYADYANLGYTEIKQTVLDSGQVVYDRHFTQTGRRFILDTLSSLFE
jgi:DNA-binding Lrp family transcriptional regulator